MFTGLIEDVGTIGGLRLQQKSAVLTVKTKLPVRSMARGASVAVNGACLTVVKKGLRSFTVDVSPETLQRTSLETLAVGSMVNLERPMRLARSARRTFSDGACATVSARSRRSESKASLPLLLSGCRRRLGCCWCRKDRSPSMASV